MKDHVEIGHSIKYDAFRLNRDQDYLPFTRVNRKFQLEDQMVCAVPFGELLKMWALTCGDAIFLLFFCG